MVYSKQFLLLLCSSFLLNILFYTYLVAQNTDSERDTNVFIQICKEGNFSLQQQNTSCFEDILVSELNVEKYQNKIWLKIVVSDTSQKVIKFDKNIDSIKVHFDNKMFLSGRSVAQSEKHLSISRNINVVRIPVYKQHFFVEIINSKKLPISTNITILTNKEFNQNYVNKRQLGILFHTFFQGMLWVILLYNLLIFFATKQKVYIAYCIYIFGFSIFNAQNTGFLDDFFIPEMPYISEVLRVMALGFIFFGYIYFAIKFLPSYTINKFWGKFLKTIYILTLCCVVLSIIFYYGLENERVYKTIARVIFGSIMLSMFVFFGYLARKYWSEPLIKYFLIGSFCVVGGAFVFNILQVFNGITNNAYLFVQTGGILEILIFSLGLGYRMKQLEKENAKILENQNKVLEQKVTLRTREITVKQEEILVQNEELHQQQEEIISQRDYIETQNQQLKVSNTQFTDSVRYAKTIQKAILPMKQRFQTHFEDSFVLFRPRDIVSGDFYWIYETKDEQTGEETTLLAVLDCTGHGVPGAFISLIGFAILNEIVAKENITSPSKILKRLDERIQESLRQKQNQNLDGMDVAMCSIKKTSSYKLVDYEIKFSGAKRPLYFLKNNKLEEIKGSKFSIGGFTRKKLNKEYEFEEQTIILSRNDTIYITTDGFADQHGADKRKIGSTKLKNCFEEFQEFPLAEQRKKLEQILDLHQGKQKQRDDITILGLKL